MPLEVPRSPATGHPSPRAEAAFYISVFGLSGVMLAPVALTRTGVLSLPAPSLVPLILIADFAPLLCTVALSRLDPGRALGRGPFRQLAPPRVAAGWYAGALLLPGAILLAALSAYWVVTGRQAGPWLSPPANAEQVAAMLLVPFADQIGWRGFAFPPMERRFGALGASLFVGAAWGLWHIFKLSLFRGGLSVDMVAVLLLLFTAGNVVFTWFYARTGRSLLIVVLVHMGAWLNNSAQALPANTTPIALHAVGYAVVALALVLFDRAAWRDEGKSRARPRAAGTGVVERLGGA